jgi:hypothetical protein
MAARLSGKTPQALKVWTASLALLPGLHVPPRLDYLQKQTSKMRI